MICGLHRVPSCRAITTLWPSFEQFLTLCSERHTASIVRWCHEVPGTSACAGSDWYRPIDHSERDRSARAAENVHVQVRQLRLKPLVGRAVHRRQEEFRARRFVLVRQFSMSIESTSMPHASLAPDGAPVGRGHTFLPRRLIRMIGILQDGEMCDSTSNRARHDAFRARR